MKLSFTREQLLDPLQHIIGAVEKRQTMPILSNVLLGKSGDYLQLTGTDLEIELVARTDIEVKESVSATVPARKLLDICKNLPEGATVGANIADDRVTLNTGRSRFVLATLPADEFPVLEDIQTDIAFEVPQAQLRSLIERTAFAMAQQDVRYYLNGLLLESSGSVLRAVATDGHRLALCDSPAGEGLPEGRQVIIPRKGVLELQRLLGDSEDPVKIAFGSNHVCVELNGLRYTSKLIDGRFPDYERVMPSDGDKVVVADRQVLKQALTRTAILSNEKYRGVRLSVVPGVLKIQTQNPDKEEAEEELEVSYSGEELEVAFNVTYLLDVLGVLNTDQIHLILKDANSSCLIQDDDSSAGKYVIMPMRL